MIELRIKEKSKEVALWEEKLVDLSLAHRIISDPAQELPMLLHGREKYHGKEAIANYLIELEKFVYNWRKCACEG